MSYRELMTVEYGEGRVLGDVVGQFDAEAARPPPGGGGADHDSDRIQHMSHDRLPLINRQYGLKITHPTL